MQGMLSPDVQKTFGFQVCFLRNSCRLFLPTVHQCSDVKLPRDAMSILLIYIYIYVSWSITCKGRKEKTSNCKDRINLRTSQDFRMKEAPSSSSFTPGIFFNPSQNYADILSFTTARYEQQLIQNGRIATTDALQPHRILYSILLNPHELATTATILASQAQRCVLPLKWCVLHHIPHASLQRNLATLFAPRCQHIGWTSAKKRSSKSREPGASLNLVLHVGEHAEK